MTKIAITPNASGTGTFTIAAPDSNTNRTLTLPDAAGEVYSQGNILGTVSETGGVPTGAVIERGSNANGSFVKYADGTQICFINFTENRSSSGVLVSTLTYPSAFADIDIPPNNAADRAILSCELRSAAAFTTTVEWRVNDVGTTTFDLRVDRSTTANSVFLITAMGRWF